MTAKTTQTNISHKDKIENIDDNGDRQKIIHFALDENSVPHNAEVEHERRVAIFDLLEKNSFAPLNCPPGPYHVTLSLVDKGLKLNIRDKKDEDLKTIELSLIGFRRIVKDYFLICENHYQAVRVASPDKIETIDQGRRALHNEAAELLQEKLARWLIVDFDTARRLFTLICVLHARHQKATLGVDFQHFSSHSSDLTRKE